MTNLQAENDKNGNNVQTCETKLKCEF